MVLTATRHSEEHTASYCCIPSPHTRLQQNSNEFSLEVENKTKDNVLSKSYVHTRNRFQRSEACIDIRSFRPCSHNPRSSRTGRDASRTRPRLPDIVYDVKVLILLKGLLVVWVKVTNLCKLFHSAAPQNPRHSRNGTIQSHSRTSSSRHT